MEHSTTQSKNFDLTIRQESIADHEQVGQIVAAAFEKEEMSDQTEHLLVARLRKSEAFVPELSLVAEVDGSLVGHILLTRIVIREGDEVAESLALAPVSVLPDWQGKGIGGQLIEEAHRVAREMGFGSVLLLGHADYYPRFGYRKASDFGIRLPFEVPDENCMAAELQAGSLKEVTGLVEYPPAFGL